MIKFREAFYSVKKFAPPKSKILDTGSDSSFIKGRKYDTDMDRLSRRSVQNELSTASNQLNKEMQKANKELNVG